MKFIHTSDWHLGQQLYNFDRQDEQAHMLSQVEALVREESPDALLVCGDIHHTAQPSAAVQKMFTDSILKMHEACPSMHIILTAGNHDSGSRHEIFRGPWEALNVHVLGRLDKDGPQKHIIKVGDKGVVAAVPFVSDRNLPDGFYQELIDLALVSAREEVVGNARPPLVLMAHTTVSGLDWTGHEGASERCVGGIDALSLDKLGVGYDYLALGHIHHAQWLDGERGRARYSGTPLPVSFDETFAHTLSVVEIAEGGSKPVLREVEVRPMRPLVTLPPKGARPWGEVRQMLAALPPDVRDCYLRLMVQVEDVLPASANAEAQRIADSKDCRFCYIQSVRTQRESLDARCFTVEELQREEPEEIAKRFVEDQGLVWDEELSEMFKEIVDLVEEDEREE